MVGHPDGRVDTRRRASIKFAAMAIPKAPNLLNDDGTASMATAFMSSHHAFRRDIAQFARALGRVAAGDHARVGALREEWAALLRHAARPPPRWRTPASSRARKQQHPELAAVIDGLFADHRKMDPMLEEGERAFAGLPTTVEAASGIVVAPVGAAGHPPGDRGDPHHTVPARREGVPAARQRRRAGDVRAGLRLEQPRHRARHPRQALRHLPATVVAKLPAARAAFAKRCEDVWGTAAAGASRTPIPDWL